MKRFALAVALSVLALSAQAGEPDCEALRKMMNAQRVAAAAIQPKQQQIMDNSAVVFVGGDAAAATAMVEAVGSTFGALTDMLTASQNVMREAGCLSD
jgi:hypothetical protein